MCPVPSPNESAGPYQHQLAMARAGRLPTCFPPLPGLQRAPGSSRAVKLSSIGEPGGGCGSGTGCCYRPEQLKSNTGANRMSTASVACRTPHSPSHAPCASSACQCSIRCVSQARYVAPTGVMWRRRRTAGLTGRAPQQSKWTWCCWDSKQHPRGCCSGACCVDGPWLQRHCCKCKDASEREELLLPRVVSTIHASSWTLSSQPSQTHKHACHSFTCCSLCASLSGSRIRDHLGHHTTVSTTGKRARPAPLHSHWNTLKS